MDQKPSSEFVVPGSLSVRRQRMREGPSPVWIVWRPHTCQSVSGDSPESFSQLLKLCKWPPGTPTGDRLRDWLVEWGHVRKKKGAKKKEISKELEATGFGPECHLDETDPNHNTKTII